MADFIYKHTIGNYGKKRQQSYSGNRVCKTHLLSFWGKDENGEWYKRCSAGHRLNQDCEELKQDE